MKWKCFFGFHQWYYWADFFRSKILLNYKNDNISAYFALRRCTYCEKLQFFGMHKKWVVYSKDSHMQPSRLLPKKDEK